MTLVFTLCSNNYLAQAITLGGSLLKYNPDYLYRIGLVDRRCESINYGNIPFEIVEVESIGIDRFEEMFRRYTVTELNTAVKPFYFRYFWQKYPGVREIIFLDPDIQVYRPFKYLEEILKEHEIVLTPHFTTPINDERFQSENNFLNSGIYNLGFIAIRKGKESEKLLQWWAERLVKKAHIDFANGMFTDQIWMNLAPLYFKNINILVHPGYNMAYWNLHERELSGSMKVRKDGTEDELVFFHFSGYDPSDPEVLSKYQDRFSFKERTDIAPIFEGYRESLLENNYRWFITLPSYFETEKKKIDLEAAKAFKRTIPYYKRAIRGIILRVIRLFRINIDYYTRV